MASATLPYNRKFKDDVKISAYSALEPVTNRYDMPYGSRTILYPRDRDLRLKVDFSQPSYRPGEDASISFLTRAANGKSSESALGVVIFDKAVEERARADREFGGVYGFGAAYSLFQGSSEVVGGITRNDLDRVDSVETGARGIRFSSGNTSQSKR